MNKQLNTEIHEEMENIIVLKEGRKSSYVSAFTINVVL